jgi:hypothetical protein
MEQTPLQKYRNAYQTHYKENNPKQAKVLYQELIDAYPNTDVAVYATMQLSALRNNGGPDSSDDAVQRASNPFFPILTGIAFVLALAACTAVILQYRYMTKRESRAALLIQAIGKMHEGSYEDALVLLNEVKVTSREDLTPYMLSSDIYCRYHNFLKARGEFEAYERLYPGNPLARTEIAKIDKKEDTFIHDRMSRETEQEIPEEPVKTRPKKKANAAQFREPDPSPRIISKEGISYF